MDLTERTLEENVIYDGAILRLRRDLAALPNGNTAYREVIEHPGGVAILPLLPDGTVLCVRQWRYPYGQALLELPAGKLDLGEDHRLAALRELKEEVGAVPGQLDYLGRIYPSPGYTNEILHLYLARELSLGESQPDDDEFLNVERYSLDELSSMIFDQKLVDGKTVAAVFMTQQLLEKERNS